MSTDILIAGVGGQGTILASKLLAAAALAAGRFARTSETIGMAQRGGSVVSHVRLDSREQSPTIPLGQADLLLGFEPAEAARNLCRLKPGGICIVNTQPVMPVTASLAGGAYPYEEILAYLRQNSRALLLDGNAAAAACGSIKAVNTVLLGAACGCGALPLSPEQVLAAIIASVPPRLVELNQDAFQRGYQMGKEQTV